MHLYVLRHGIAIEPFDWDGNDGSRPLTLEGRERTEAIIETLKRQDKLQVDAIWSSPLVRAEETAEIAGKVLKLPVTIIKALSCGASLKRLQTDFKARAPLPERLLLTGHEPDCGMIISGLIGDAEGDYALKKTGIALLKGTFEPGGMKLLWKLAPKDILE